MRGKQRGERVDLSVCVRGRGPCYPLFLVMGTESWIELFFVYGREREVWLDLFLVYGRDGHGRYLLGQDIRRASPTFYYGSPPSGALLSSVVSSTAEAGRGF